MALPSIKNSVGMAVTAVADAGVGTLTVGAALSGGYQTAGSAHGANAVSDFRFEEGDLWETAIDCAYDHTAGTVSRGTQTGGSSGPSTRVTFTTAAKVYEILDETRIERAIKTAHSIVPGGRLSGVTDNSTGDTNSTTTIYYTPFVHNVILLWDGADWVPTVFTEKSLPIGTLASGKCHDVFGYLAAGELALEFGTAWTNNTTRATGAGAISRQDGRLCKGAGGDLDKTRLLLGTIFTATATTTIDNTSNRYIGNQYNLFAKYVNWSSGDASHTYSSDTYRLWNNNSAAVLKCVSTGQSNSKAWLVCGSNIGSDQGWLQLASSAEGNGWPNASLVMSVGVSAGAGYTEHKLEQRAFSTVTFNWGFIRGRSEQ